ncbi:ABC transporter transmembrane domain-containing protein [Klenkia terrae]|uniref:ABC transporter transmembrane domain-containing protein n=1 Tax=Klenkia terrae TaxID=1052259 RepID=A0ABU8EB59_9ACTN
MDTLSGAGHRLRAAGAGVRAGLLGRRAADLVPRVRVHLLGTAALGAGAATAAILAAVALSRALTGERQQLGVLVAAVLLRAGAGWLREWWAHRSARRAVGELRAGLVDRTTTAGPGALDPSEVALLATDGLDRPEEDLAVHLPARIEAAVLPVAVLVVVAVVDPPTALILLVVLVLLTVFLVLVGLVARDEADARLHTLTRLGAQLLDLVAGLPTLRALGRDQDEVAVVEARSRAHRRATVRTLRTASLSGLVLELDLPRVAA